MPVGWHFTARAVQVNVIGGHLGHSERAMSGTWAFGTIGGAASGQERRIAGPGKHRGVIVHDRPELEAHDLDGPSVGDGPADEGGVLRGGLPGGELHGHPGLLRHCSVLHAHTIIEPLGFVKRYFSGVTARDLETLRSLYPVVEK